MRRIILLVLLSVILILSACNVDKPEIIDEKVLEEEGYDISIETSKITYLSDGLKVMGYLVKPVDIDEKLPVIIFNRGGNRSYGMIPEKMALQYFEFLASHNYVVLASQYRGVEGGEGMEQFGGDDLNDVLNLIKIAKKLPYVDKKQIFMIGGSRGGMMTYMACRESKDIKAAAVIAGVSDVIQMYEDREPKMKQVLLDLIGGNPEELPDEYEKRSAVNWADEINTPLIIFHGGKDWRVDISQAEKMVEQLEKYDKDYKLLTYPDGDHSLTGINEIYDEIFKWFDEHK